MRKGLRVNRLKHWSVSILGLLLFGAASGHVLTDDDLVLTSLIEVGLPILIGVILAIGGAWLQRTCTADRTGKIAAWTVGGTIVGHAINLWFIVIMSLEQTPAGDPVPLNLNGAAIFMGAAAVIGYYYTGFVNREQELERSDARFQALTENASFGVITIDESSTIRYANDAVEGLFGYTPENLIGEQLTVLMPESLEASHLDGLDRYLSSGSRQIDWDGVELTGQHAKGRELPIEISFGEYEVEDDHLFTGVIRDISDRKTAEKQLRTHTDRVTDLHRIANDILSAKTRKDVYQATVDAAADLFPCDVARLAVADGGQLVPAASSLDEPLDECDPIAMTEGYAGQSFQSGDPVVVDDLTFTRSGVAGEDQSSTSWDGPGSPSIRDGGTAPDSQPETYRSLLTVPLDDVGVLQLLAVDADAFESHDSEVATLLASHTSTGLARVRAEESLRRERDRLDDFANVLSHDIRNPLNVAQGRLELAEKTADQPTREHLEAADHAQKRIERLIDDTLTLAREGESVGETEPIDLGVLARKAWDTVSTETATLEIDSAEQIEGDWSRLTQVFENLYRNAIEHGGEDVTVTVGSMADGFYIEDTGTGIPEDEREDVFGSGYTTSSEGTGFGLAIIEQIIEAHGWTISVTDGTDGGARFEIRTREALEA